MATKITKAEFDALPDSLKTKFEAAGDEFALIEEDVEGLKKSKADILKEKKDLQDKLDEALRFKAEHEKAKEAEETEKQKEAGQFAELEKKLRDKIAEVEADRDAKVGGILGNLKTERLKNLLIEKGVLPDRANYALHDLSEQFDLESGEQGFTLKLKSGIGDPKEIDATIDGLKQKSPFFFAASGASGSGASGSDKSGGNAKTMPKSQWDTLGVKEQAAFIREGGKPVD